MKDYIEIDGNVIRKDSITAVTKISLSGAGATSFILYDWYEFDVKYNGTYLHISECFRVNFFTNRPKKQRDKDEAYRIITEKRENILKEISE